MAWLAHVTDAASHVDDSWWWVELALTAVVGLVFLWVALRGPRRRGGAQEAAREDPPARRRPAKAELRKLIGQRGRLITMRGEVVQSKPERRIADFLHRRGIDYEYEKRLDGATPDFFLPGHNVIIEHWGMAHTKYLENRGRKTRMYRSRGYKLVETEKKDVPYLEAVLEARLRKADPTIFERAR